MRTLLILAGATTLAVGVKGPTPVQDVRPYRSWPLVTPNPIDMEPTIMVSCIGPAKWDANQTNPHIPKLFRVFVNPKGRDEMRRIENPAQPVRQKPSFPAGTIIVKEKFDMSQAEGRPFARKLKPGAKPELLTVMIKRERGFDPQNGDWEYLVLDGSMKKSERVAVRHCQSCHRDRKDRDYVFGAYGALSH